MYHPLSNPTFLDSERRQPDRPPTWRCCGTCQNAFITRSPLTIVVFATQPDQEVEEVGEDEDEDEEYTPAPEITGPATAAVAVSPPPAIGRKRSRDEQNDGDEEAADLAGDYGEAEENSEAVTKKARAAADDEE